MQNMSETIYWHLAADRLPDADESVLIIVASDVEAIPGYLDGENWRNWHGLPIDAKVLLWACWPQGPQS